MEEENCIFARNTKTSQCTSIAHAATSRGPGSVWMYRDVQSIAHITYIVEMNTVENSLIRFQLLTILKYSFFLSLDQKLKQMQRLLVSDKAHGYVDLKCSSSCSSLRMYWVIYVTEYLKGCPPIGYVPVDL